MRGRLPAHGGLPLRDRPRPPLPVHVQRRRPGPGPGPDQVQCRAVTSLPLNVNFSREMAIYIGLFVLEAFQKGGDAKVMFVAALEGVKSSGLLSGMP
mmetsp:Transcript_49564/g.99036  ORF Transcript_49564/g.99036 Transcript_49564/m.99036 type:complete len:97 (-) Transcript_49564:289-579(-)